MSADSPSQRADPARSGCRPGPLRPPKRLRKRPDPAFLRPRMRERDPPTRGGRLAVRRVEAVPACPGGELDAVPRPEPVAQVLDVVLDRVGAQVQAPADLVVRQAAGNELDELNLRLAAWLVGAQDLAEKAPLAPLQVELEDGRASRRALDRPRRLRRRCGEVKEARQSQGEERLQLPGTQRLRAADEPGDRQPRSSPLELATELKCGLFF